MMAAAADVLGSILDLRGPEFLTLYFFLVLFAFTGLAIYRNSVDRTMGEPMQPLPKEFDPRELAWLRGGTAELVRLSGLDLVQRGYVLQVGSRLSQHPSPPPKRFLAKPLQTMLEIVKDAPSPRDLLQRTGLAFALEAKEYEDRARAAKFLGDGAAQERMNTAATFVALVLLSLGALKIYVALQRGRHNIGFLVVLMIAVFVGALLIRKLPRLSARGRAYLERSQSALAQLRARVPTLARENDPLLVLAAGAFGLNILTTTSYDSYYRYFVPHQHSVATSSGSSCGSGCASLGGGGGSSCGSGGSSCSSGCGGGCGGGGCGGCGS